MQKVSDWHWSLARGCLVLIITLLPQTTHAQTGGQNHSAAKGLTLIDVMHHKLEAIRVHMGKPVNEVPNIKIEGAVAREVYYQAVNLYQKADRLAQEVARDTVPLKVSGLNGGRSKEDVAKVLDAAMTRIDLVVENLGIQSASPADTHPLMNATESDLYVAILTTNQRINQLLEKKFSPSEVFQQVTKALYITLTLFERFPESRRILAEPEFIPGKTPSDVFMLLLDCYALVREIAITSDMKVLEFVSVKKNDLYIPSEVYDIATLLVSELTYIHDSVPGLTKADESYFPGRKYPSDVYQRGRHLKQTLQRLRDLIAANPDWRK